MLKRKSFRDKAFRILALICIFSLALCGCANEKKEATNDTVTITDRLGRRVSVMKKPERVAALLGSFADVWVLAGGEICAAPDDADEDFGINMENAVNLGGAHSPGAEALISSEPKLVIASASTPSNVSLCPLLENAGIDVLYFDVDNFDDYLKMLDVCTDITDRKDLYEEHGVKVKKRIDEIKKEFQSSDISEDEKKILLLRVSSGAQKAKGSSGTVLGEMLYDLGLENIADNDESLLENLSVESIIEKQPYRIFVVTMGKDTKKATDNLLRLIKDNPSWGMLEAVRENRVHIMDRRLFNNKPNEEWADAYEQLCDILLEKNK